MDLWQASCDGDARAVDALLANERLGLDLNCVEDKYGMTPLYIASQEGHAEVVSMLLAKQGIDVNQAEDHGATPLLIASEEGHAEVVSMLLAKEGIDVNQTKIGRAHV